MQVAWRLHACGEYAREVAPEAIRVLAVAARFPQQPQPAQHMQLRTSQTQQQQLAQPMHDVRSSGAHSERLRTMIQCTM